MGPADCWNGYSPGGVWVSFWRTFSLTYLLDCHWSWGCPLLAYKPVALADDLISTTLIGEPGLEVISTNLGEGGLVSLVFDTGLDLVWESSLSLWFISSIGILSSPFPGNSHNMTSLITSYDTTWRHMTQWRQHVTWRHNASVPGRHQEEPSQGTLHYTQDMVKLTSVYNVHEYNAIVDISMNIFLA